MSSLIRSSAILAFARFTNYALLFLSPILLVRILSPYGFGQYREFMVYATLISSLATFSIPANLLYFIPYSPDKTRHYVSNTNVLVGAASLIAGVVIWLFRAPMHANTSYDFLTLLAIYVVLFINLDFFESYWIATKRPENVFYYSTLRTVFRLAAVVGAAFFARSVEAILHAIIVVEAFRILIVLIIMHRLRLLSADIERTTIREQLAFIMPLGLAGSLHYINESIGQIAVSTQLGVVALAIYTIGNYQVPILSIVRGAIGDAIFPDMVQQAAKTSGDRLLLWKRSNIAFSFVIIPVFVALLWYADVLIPFVFSERYVESVPLFRIMLLVMLLQCFEFSSPLRAVKRTTPLLFGNIVMVVVNLACIVAIFHFLPSKAIFGPAVGLVTGYVVQLVFFGWCVKRTFDAAVLDLLKWRSLATLASCAAVAAVLLVAGEYIAAPAIVRVLVFSTLFGGAYLTLVLWAGIEEVQTVTTTLLSKLRDR